MESQPSVVQVEKSKMVTSIQDLFASLPSIDRPSVSIHWMNDSSTSEPNLEQILRQTKLLVGPGVMEETFCGLKFQISMHSFFQTNTEAAERFFCYIRDHWIHSSATEDSPIRTLQYSKLLGMF